MTIKPDKILDHFAKDYQYQTYLAKKICYKKADDLLQEAYIKLHKRFTEKNKCYEHYNITADRMYIYLIMSNLNTDIYRTTKPHEEINQNIIEEEDNVIEEKQMLEKKIQKVNDILNTLDHWYDKELFKLYWHSGKSLRKISEETHISLSSIFTTIKFVKNYIKENYEDEEEN